MMTEIRRFRSINDNLVNEDRGVNSFVVGKLTFVLFIPFDKVFFPTEIERCMDEEHRLIPVSLDRVCMKFRDFLQVHPIITDVWSSPNDPFIRVEIQEKDYGGIDEDRAANVFAATRTTLRDLVVDWNEMMLQKAGEVQEWFEEELHRIRFTSEEATFNLNEYAEEMF